MSAHANSHLDADLTKGPIGYELWQMAWPMMLSFFFFTLYNLVDAYWVGQLSAQAIAAVSISQVTLFIMMSLGIGITAGSGVLMAMEIGAKKIPDAERILGQSFVLSTLAGLFFTVIGLVFHRWLLVASGASGAILPLAIDYFVISAAGTVLMFWLGNVMFAFNAQGDTFSLTKLFALSTAINIVLDPILIFGWFGLPPLGIKGAAIATIISQLVFIIFATRSLSSPNRLVRFAFKNFTYRWHSVKNVLAIGIPAALTQVLGPIGSAALTFLAGSAYGEDGAIAFSLGTRIEFFAYLPAVGFGFAGMAMIGQSLGAKNRDRAEKILLTTILYGSSAALAIGVMAAIFANPIIQSFTTNTSSPAAINGAILYLRTVALSYGFLAMMMICTSSFQAMGKSWPGFWVFFTRIFILCLPATYIFTHLLKYPIWSQWLTLVVANVLSAILAYVWVVRSMRSLNLKDIPLE